jgi:3-oxoadipate enol-lactonase
MGLQLSAHRIPNHALVRQADDRLEHLPSGGALHIRNEAAGTLPLLFLHGLGGAAWSWAPQVEALAADHPCFVWEARGHGAAQPAADAGFAEYLVDAREALAVVIERTRLPALVVGHSAGGYLAMALGCEVAAAVGALFLVEPFYRRLYPNDAIASLADPLVRPGAHFIARSHQRGGRLARWIFQHAFALGFEDHDAMEQAWKEQQKQLPFDYPRMFLDALEGPVNFPTRSFANDLSVPIYLLEGSSARRRPRFPALVEGLRARLGEVFTYDVIPGGHYLQLDRPDEVTQRLEAFADMLGSRR